MAKKKEKKPEDIAYAVSSLQLLSPTRVDGVWVLLIDSGSSAEDRQWLGLSAAVCTAHF